MIISSEEVTLDILQNSHKLSTIQHNENKLSISLGEKKKSDPDRDTELESKTVAKLASYPFFIIPMGKKEVQLHPMLVPTR